MREKEMWFCRFFFKKNYWSVVDLQHCVSFRCRAEWFMYTYMYIEYWVEFPALYGRSLLITCFIYSSMLTAIADAEPSAECRRLQLGGSPGLGDSFQGHLCRRCWLKWKGQSFLKESESRTGWKNEGSSGMESNSPQRKECAFRRRRC